MGRILDPRGLLKELTDNRKTTKLQLSIHLLGVKLLGPLGQSGQFVAASQGVFALLLLLAGRMESVHLRMDGNTQQQGAQKQGRHGHGLAAQCTGNRGPQNGHESHCRQSALAGCRGRKEMGSGRKEKTGARK